MKKAAIITTSAILAFFLAIALTIFIFLELNPLYKSHDALKSYLLNITPIGTNMDDAKSAVRKAFKLRNSDVWVDMEMGYKINDRGLSYTYGLDSSYTIVGEKSIYFDFGQVGFNFVGAYYAFDENDKLIEILVVKTLDVL